MTRGTLLLFCGAALLNLSATAFADAIYKTVDAQGHVSYTSRNPALDNTATPKAQEIKVDSGYNNTLPITRIGSTDYCGEIALPTRTLEGQHFYENVANARRNWSSTLQDIEKRATQFSRYGQKDSSATVQKMSQLRCAVGWADQQRNQAMEERIELARKSQGLNEYLKDKGVAQIKACGQEPIYSPLDGQFEEHRRNWRTCTDEYRNKLRDAESDLRATDRQLLDISKIESAR